MDFTKVKESLLARGFAVSTFATAAEAADYIDSQLDETSVGFGGSMTLKELGLYERLKSHNSVFSHWEGNKPAESMTTDHYLLSANGLAETGEIINIDANGNRVSAALYGHKKVWFIIGNNKIAPTYDEALWRARNIAAPKNAQRLGRKTPCAIKGDRCYECKSPERACRALVVLWEKIGSMEMEVVLVDEPLGY